MMKQTKQNKKMYKRLFAHGTNFFNDCGRNNAHIQVGINFNIYMYIHGWIIRKFLL